MSYKATWPLYPVETHVRPMKYWLGHLREHGLGRTLPKIEEIAGSVTTIAGVDDQNRKFEIGIDRAKGFVPVRIQVWRISPIFLNTSKTRFSHDVRFSDAQQTDDGRWYFGRMDSKMDIWTQPWEQVESTLTALEFPAVIQPSEFEIAIEDDVELIDYTQFGHWWRLHRPTLDVEDPLDYTTWPASFVDYAEQWGETAHSFWYAFPDFRGLHFALGLVGCTIAALVFWRLRGRRAARGEPDE